MKKGFLKKHATGLNLCLKFSDILCLILSAFISYIIRFKTYHMTDHYTLISLIGIIVLFLTFNHFGAYSAKRGSSLQKEIVSIIGYCIISFIITIVLVFVLKLEVTLSRLWFSNFFIFSLLLIIVLRIFLRTFLFYIRKRGYNVRNICLIVDVYNLEFIQKIDSFYRYGYKVNKIFGENGTLDKNLEDIYTAAAYIKRATIDGIWIVASLKKIDLVEKIVSIASEKAIPITFFPSMHEVFLINHSFTEINGIPAINLQDTPLSGVDMFLKRSFDILLSSIALIILSPLFLIIAILVKYSSPGPVFYRQLRVSQKNKFFYILKFRSMPVGIEKTTGAIWAKLGENRATTFGSFLRKTSLDELPQFINVLIGNMSIVGPRPERPELIKDFKKEIPNYMKKHLMKAGITGWAQVNGLRGDTCLKTRIEYDLYYVNNWSLSLDIQIMLMTFIKGIFNKNAY